MYLRSILPGDSRRSRGSRARAAYLLLVILLDEVGEGALTAVVAVVVHGHEDARAAHLVRALLAELGHLVVAVDLVVLEHSKLDLLVLVLDLLRLGVHLLLALL